MTLYITELEHFRGVPLYSICPKCSNDKTYQRYINKNGTYVSEEFGKCNSINGCDYDNKPEMPKFVPYFFDESKFIKSLDYSNGNNLFNFLKSKYGYEQAVKAMEHYKVGTSKRYQGAAIFWQIDREDKKRTGKIVFFDSKGVENIKGWVHNETGINSCAIRNCMFGEHLLNNKINKTVVIVENERAAIEGWCKLPDYTWLSNEGHGLCYTKKLLLAGRKVICEPKSWS